MGSKTSQSVDHSEPSAKIGPWGVVLIVLVVLIGCGFAYFTYYNTTHHSVTLRISGEEAVVKVTYTYSIPNPEQNKISRQTTEMSVSIPWETKFDIEGLEPSVTLKVERQAKDSRPLSCAVIIGGKTNVESMALGQTNITCQEVVEGPEKEPIPTAEHSR